MFKLLVVSALCLLTAEAYAKEGRIVGGTTANISQFPFAAVLLVTENNRPFRQNCGGTIINNRSILSAPHCWDRPNLGHAVRVGSTNANSGGQFLNVHRHITHPNYVNSGGRILSDIGIVRLSDAISFGGNVRAGPIPGANVNTPDNVLVSAIGWGLLYTGGFLSETLQHVHLRVVPRARCQSIYNSIDVNAGTICASADIDGRGTCQGDSGGPLVHNGVAVGVLSFGGRNCGLARWPSVYVRIASYTQWIVSNA